MQTTSVRSEVFMVMKIQVMVFWIVTMCYDVGYQCFRVPCCLHLHFTLKMEAAQSAEMLVTYHIMTQCHNPEDSNLILLLFHML